MTKHTFIFWAIIAILSSCEDIKSPLSGQLSGVTDDMQNIYLLKISTPDEFYVGSNRLVIDSAKIDENGKFIFDQFHTLDKSYMYRLNLVTKDEPASKIIRDYQSNSYVFLINDGYPISITGDAGSLYKTYDIESAGTLNHKLTNIRDIELAIFEHTSEYMPKYKEVSNDPDRLNQLRTEFFSELKKILNTSLVPAWEEILSTESDPRIASLLLKQMDLEMDIQNIIKDVKSVIGNIKPSHQNHPYLLWWNKEVKKSELIPVGSKVPNIKLQTPSGKSIELYNIKSKLILVDFWASWCSPCRKENKEIVKPLYDEYKKDGLEVFGVSIDTDKKKWQNAITSDGISWTQVSDLKGKESKVWKDYYLEQLPTTFLINSEFEVVAKNLRGEKLKLFIEDYFN